MTELDHEHRLTAVEQRAKSNSKRLDELEQRQDSLEELTASVSALATKQGYMEGDLKEIKADVKTLAGKPGRRWEAIADKVIWAVLAALVALVLGRLGL